MSSYCKCDDGRGLCKIKKALCNQSDLHERRLQTDGIHKMYGNGIIKNNELIQLAHEINNENLTGGELYDNVNTIAKYINLGLQTYKDLQKYDGEFHVPLFVNNRLELASYMGPGTNLIQRLKNNDKPKSYADLVSKLHDINYTLSQTVSNKDEQKQLVRDADILMLSQIQSGKNKKLDNRLNLYLASSGISTKVKLENKNIPIVSNKLHNIAGNLKTFSQSDINLLNTAREQTLNEINQQLQ